LHIVDELHLISFSAKESNKENSRLRSDPMSGSALAGPVVAGSVLMPTLGKFWLCFYNSD